MQQNCSHADDFMLMIAYHVQATGKMTESLLCKHRWEPCLVCCDGRVLKGGVPWSAAIPYTTIPGKHLITMPTPQPSPELGLPASNNTVRVSIIDPGSAVSNVRTTTFVEPELPGFSHHPTLPAYAFLVEHPSGEKHIFDLSIRKDWKNLTPATVDKLQSWEWVVETKASVSEVLTDAGVELDAIKGIIWR